jgi:5'-3' exoribonuclease 1
MREIFVSIMNYLNFLINTVKPTKRIFIAVDGVAPRAKNENQRHRRFHTAKQLTTNMNFLTKTLESQPGMMEFKHNSITPGTQFMYELCEHLHLFVQKKLDEDENWRKCKVFLSGGDVPGEGEHKLMEFIRGWKQSPEFDINESNCIYGNDSDLI